jgi:hypothetical protein
LLKELHMKRLYRCTSGGFTLVDLLVLTFVLAFLLRICVAGIPLDQSMLGWVKYQTKTRGSEQVLKLYPGAAGQPMHAIDRSTS